MVVAPSVGQCVAAPSSAALWGVWPVSGTHGGGTGSALRDGGPASSAPDAGDYGLLGRSRWPLDRVWREVSVSCARHSAVGGPLRRGDRGAWDDPLRARPASAALDREQPALASGTRPPRVGDGAVGGRSSGARAAVCGAWRSPEWHR